jgi:hypothetical protein
VEVSKLASKILDVYNFDSVHTVLALHNNGGQIL